MALCYNVKEVVYLLHALISVRTFIMAIIDNGHLMAIKWPLKFLKAILPIYSENLSHFGREYDGDDDDDDDDDDDRRSMRERVSACASC